MAHWPPQALRDEFIAGTDGCDIWEVDKDPRILIEGHEEDVCHVAVHPRDPAVFATACASGKVRGAPCGGFACSALRATGSVFCGTAGGRWDGMACVYCVGAAGAVARNACWVYRQLPLFADLTADAQPVHLGGDGRAEGYQRSDRLVVGTLPAAWSPLRKSMSGLWQVRLWHGGKRDVVRAAHIGFAVSGCAFSNEEYAPRLAGVP